MNKYLLLTAAALLATTASAEQSKGGQRQFQFGTSGGGSFCDGGTGYWSGDQYYWVHTNADCAGASYLGGPGLLSKNSEIGKHANLFDTAAYALAGEYCSIAFPPKFAYGPATVLCIEGSGVSEGQILLMPPNGTARSGKSSLSFRKALLERARAGR